MFSDKSVSVIVVFLLSVCLEKKATIANKSNHHLMPCALNSVIPKYRDLSVSRRLGYFVRARPIIVIIINSKYFPVSDWLNPHA